VTFNPRNILVIDFGQLGDVVMSLRPLREKSTGPAHIAAAVGTPVVVLIDLPTPHTYIPFGTSQR